MINFSGLKKCFLDVETTGIDIEKDEIYEIGFVIETPEASDEIQIRVCPSNINSVNEEALALSGRSKKDLEAYPFIAKGYQLLIDTFSTYIDRYNKSDKFHLYGWWINFDDQFLRKFFDAMRDKYYGSWFFTPAIDIAALTAEKLLETRHQLPNFKLTTVAKHLGIEVDESATHGALYDAKLARKVYYALSSL